jgi:hypothetical protein
VPLTATGTMGLGFTTVAAAFCPGRRREVALGAALGPAEEDELMRPGILLVIYRRFLEKSQVWVQTCIYQSPHASATKLCFEYSVIRTKFTPC